MVNRSSLIIEPTQGRRSYRRVLAVPRVLNPEHVAAGGGQEASLVICARAEFPLPFPTRVRDRLAMRDVLISQPESRPLPVCGLGTRRFAHYSSVSGSINGSPGCDVIK